MNARPLRTDFTKVDDWNAAMTVYTAERDARIRAAVQAERDGEEPAVDPPQERAPAKKASAKKTPAKKAATARAKKKS